MGDAAGVGGWEAVTARNQEERSSGPGLGVPTPAHLTKTLYVPLHDGSTSNISIFEATEQYKESVKERGMGSASYVVALGRMPKPQENGIVYNVNFKDTALTLTSVASSSSAESPVEANVAIESAEDKAATITVKAQDKSEVEEISMSTSYFIPPTTWKKKVYVHPYFGFQKPGENGQYLEWQIHPVTQGRLRYTLVRNPQAKGTGDGATPVISPDEDILAIYHHIGDTLSFPLPVSEGVLLLASNLDSATEAIVVASALGLLWKLRLLCKTGESTASNSKASKKGLGFIKGLLHKN